MNKKYTDGENRAFMLELSRELRTQDNLCTADPIYIVQTRNRIFGMDSLYADDYQWVPSGDWESIMDEPEDDDGNPLSEEQAEDAGWEKVYYVTEWVFKTAHLTRKAAERYIESYRHNLTEPRIYVDSMHRCPEMIRLREILIYLTEGEKE
ncbi:MAG: hypothetical protein GY820_17290 [Gammaproteobacteria bacterium]|nr:hypothetical protein [Gammaproteobacteria bacterium]